MSDGLFDETSAAGIAQAALSEALAALRQVIATAKTASDAQAAITASQAAITAMLAAVGVAHRWTGTALQIQLPDGSYGEAVDLVGPEGPAGPAPTFAVASVTAADQPAFTLTPDPSVPNRYLIDVVQPRGEKGEKGDTPDVSDLDLSALRLPWTQIDGKPPIPSKPSDIGAAPLASPAFTGTPTAPTAAAGTDSTQLANTAFVAAALRALVGMAPAELDTLKEIADRLVADESTAAALASTVAGKLAKAANLSDLADAPQARTNLGLVIGTHVQAYDADLAAIAALTTTAFGRALLTLADAAALTANVNAFAGDAGSGGTKGLVPAPAAGDGAAGKFLKADGTWATAGSNLSAFNFCAGIVF